jgi:hypothetical protein
MPLPRSRAQVEHDGVVRVRLRHPQRVLAARRQVGGVPVVAQSPAEERAELRVVFDDEDAHPAQRADAKVNCT